MQLCADQVVCISVRPTHYIAAHTCAIRSIAFVTSPPPSTALEDAGAFELSGDPNRVATVGYDGSTAITVLRDSDGAGTVIFLHERCEPPNSPFRAGFEADHALLRRAASTYAVAWCPQSGCVYADDQDDRVRAYFLKSADYALSKRIGAHRGTIWVSFPPLHALQDRTDLGCWPSLSRNSHSQRRIITPSSSPLLQTVPYSFTRECEPYVEDEFEVISVKSCTRWNSIERMGNGE